MKELPRELIDREVGPICERYKISPDQAEEIVVECFTGQTKLLDRIQAEHGSQDVTRWKVYRKTVKEIRKRVYYRLRRYHEDREEEARLRQELREALSAGDEAHARGITLALTQLHVSTRERASIVTEFHSVISDVLGKPSCLIDIGCGYHPMTFPFKDTITRYVALERNADACETLEVFAPLAAPSELVPVCGDLVNAEVSEFLPPGVDRYDAAFMFKLIPVVARAEPDALQALANVPAETLVITASKEAMTRNQDVSRREDRSLRSFAELAGRSEMSRFDVGNEFGYFLV